METKEKEIDKKIKEIDLQIERTVKEIAKILDVEYSEELKKQLGNLIAYVSIQFEFTKEKHAVLFAKYWPKGYEHYLEDTNNNH